MVKYLIKGEKLRRGILLTYNDSGLLVGFDAEGATNGQIEWAHNHIQLTISGIPMLESQVKQWRRKGVDLHLVKVETDLSFDSFWNSYGYKKGKKSSVERIWKSMCDVERAAALTYIKKYNHYLAQNPHIQRMYPQTYLNRKEWQND